MGEEPGPGLDRCRWLYEREVAALALDNWECEVWPSQIKGANIPFHQVATPRPNVSVLHPGGEVLRHHKSLMVRRLVTLSLEINW